MLVKSIISRVSFLLLACTAVAPQVSPESPCAAICLDVGSKDVSDPISSNTFSTDIVCRDSDYVELEEGRKFKTCQRCLEKSSASKSGESDQSWFICRLEILIRDNAC